MRSVFAAILLFAPAVEAQTRGGSAGASWPLVVGLTLALILGLAGATLQRELATAAKYVCGLLLMFGLSMGVAVFLVSLEVIPSDQRNLAALLTFGLALVVPAVLSYACSARSHGEP